MRKHWIRLSMLVVAVLVPMVAAARAEAATSTLDQSNDVVPEGYLGAVEPLWQTFTAGRSGNLDRVDIGGFGLSSGSIELAILAAGQNGTLTGNVLGTGSADASALPRLGADSTANGWVSAAISPPVPIVAGRTYAIVKVARTPFPFVWSDRGGDPYAAGAAFGGLPIGFDYLFRTYVEPDPTVTGLSVPARSRTLPVTISATAAASGPGAEIVSAAVTVDGVPHPIAVSSAVTVPVAFAADGLSDGTHTVSVTATDNYGRTSSPVSDTFIVDRTAPVVVVPGAVTLEATSRNGRTVDFTATAEDALDGPVAVSCLPPSGSLFPIGVTVVDCTASDAAGNGTAASFTVTVAAPDGTTTMSGVSVPAVTRATTLPVMATAAADATGAEVAAVTAWLDDTSGAGTKLALGPGGTPVAVSGDVDISQLSDGHHSVLLRAVDDYGHTGLLYAAPFLIDRTAPSLGPVVSPNPVIKGKAAIVTPNAADAGSGLSTVSCGSVPTATLGAQTVLCSATDAAGNTTVASAAYTVIAAPSTKPADLKVTVASRPTAVSRNGLVTVTVTVRNQGPGPAYRTRPTLTFDASRLTPVNLGGAVRAGATLTWLAGDVRAGTGRTFTATFRATARGAATVTAHVVSAVPDPKLGDNRATRVITVR